MSKTYRGSDSARGKMGKRMGRRTDNHIRSDQEIQQDNGKGSRRKNKRFIEKVEYQDERW